MSEESPEYVAGALVRVEQRSVEFYDDEIVAVRADDGHVYAVLSHMCDALQIDTQGQARRIGRHKVLAKGLSWVDILSTQGDVTQRRRARVLRVDLVPLWLSGVRTSMVVEEIRPKLERFQQEAAAVLWEAFQEGRLTSDPIFDDLLKADTDAVQAYEMAQAVVKLARSQIMLEAKVEDHGKRLEAIETTLGDSGHLISEEQATQISQGIRTIALIMSKRTGRNEYGRCWGEFYRKFGVSKYRHLPAAKFERAMAWLGEWHDDLVHEVPF